MDYLLPFEKISRTDIGKVGGKNASLGEMIQHLNAAGVKVPDGFATTAAAYHQFITQNNLEKKITLALQKLNVHNLHALKNTSAKIRQLILKAPFSKEFEKQVVATYLRLSKHGKIPVAVRSSATAEDLPEASFAGQQETFLNVSGKNDLLQAIKKVFASLFTERAISYRYDHRIKFKKLAISVGVQRMVRCNEGASGVAFTLDTESGFDKVIFITACYGLGEPVVRGIVNPDEFYVFKPALEKQKFPIIKRNLGEKAIKMIADKKSKNFVKIITVPEKQRWQFCLTDKEISELAKKSFLIEQHYQMPMDVEWAKDSVDGKIYILQARPETVKSRAQGQTIERYRLKETSKIKTSGRSVGQKIGQGTARIVKNSKNMHVLKKGEILVTDMTDPDWEPIMKLAAGIVTNRGGRTCHAAIVARELGIPAIVGCGNATTVIKDRETVTVSCVEGETGHVYEGILKFDIEKINIKDLPKLPFQLCMNLGNPDKAFSYQFLPNDGVGLARLEFIIGNTIGVHPSALLKFKTLPAKLKKEIGKRIIAYADPVEFYIEKMAEGIATIAAAFYPKQVIFRFSDFKSNEYANLLGGKLFEPQEENPMIGFRGASRYVDKSFRDCFELECKAFKRVREERGLTNAQVMIPFVRTVGELQSVMELIEKFGLKRGENDLKIFMMCEIPSNAVMSENFLPYIDGFSIGSNDLTQLTLGLDRDSDLVAGSFDERNPCVKALLHHAISACNKTGKYVGICGQGPSDHPDFAKWLMEEGIQSISLTPDTIVATWLYLARRQKLD